MYEVGSTHQAAVGPPGRALMYRGGCGPPFALIPLLKIHKYSKKISVNFYHVWTLFDMDFLQNKKYTKNRNWHWALDQYVSPINHIKCCQKYVKVV